MRMYFKMFTNTLRPSSTPSSSTIKSFSSRIMSADSLAMSTALSTERPTSAARSAGASLMPSPMNPTTCLLRCSACTTRFLCAGERRANTSVVSTSLRKLFVGHVFHLAAEQDFLRVDADFAAHLARDEVVVAGEHFHRHAVLPQRGDGLGGGILGRVEKREVAGQDQFAFVGLGERGLRAEFFRRHGQHAEAVLAQLIHLLRRGRRPGSVPSGKFRRRFQNACIWRTPPPARPW